MNIWVERVLERSNAFLQTQHEQCAKYADDTIEMIGSILPSEFVVVRPSASPPTAPSSRLSAVNAAPKIDNILLPPSKQKRSRASPSPQRSHKKFNFSEKDMMLLSISKDSTTRTKSGIYHISTISPTRSPITSLRCSPTGSPLRSRINCSPKLKNQQIRLPSLENTPDLGRVTPLKAIENLTILSEKADPKCSTPIHPVVQKANHNSPATFSLGSPEGKAALPSILNFAPMSHPAEFKQASKADENQPSLKINSTPNPTLAQKTESRKNDLHPESATKPARFLEPTAASSARAHKDTSPTRLILEKTRHTKISRVGSTGSVGSFSSGASTFSATSKMSSGSSVSNQASTVTMSSIPSSTLSSSSTTTVLNKGFKAVRALRNAATNILKSNNKPKMFLNNSATANVQQSAFRPLTTLRNTAYEANKTMPPPKTINYPKANPASFKKTAVVHPATPRIKTTNHVYKPTATATRTTPSNHSSQLGKFENVAKMKSLNFGTHLIPKDNSSAVNLQKNTSSKMKSEQLPSSRILEPILHSSPKDANKCYNKRADESVSSLTIDGPTLPEISDGDSSSVIMDWARTPELQRQLNTQTDIDPTQVFGQIQMPNLESIFGRDALCSGKSSTS